MALLDYFARWAEGAQSSLKLAAGIDACSDIRAQLSAYGAAVTFGEPQETPAAILKIVRNSRRCASSLARKVCR